MKKTLILIFTFILATSCCKDEGNPTQTDSDGVIVSLPYNWKKSLHLNGVVSNSRFKAPVYYNGNIAIPTTNGGNNRLMTLIDTNNGDTIWSWDDRYQPVTEDINIKFPYQHDNLLTYQKGDRSYCINLDNGTTQWKYRRANPYSVAISGLNNDYFTFGQSSLPQYQSYDESVVFKGNLQTGNLDEFIVPDFTLNNIAPGNRIGDVTQVIPYKKEGVQYLVITWQEPQNVNSIYDWQTYLALYNYDTNQWIYKKKVMNQPNIIGVVLAPPVIYNDKIYTNIGHQLFCHKINTGEQVWVRDFPQDFMFSGFIIAEDKIIANNEDTFTYCLNPENGARLWKTETSGTCSRISYLNGIVYFVGGSSGKLHALDINTGEQVWKLDAEKLGEPSESIFKTNAVYVFPAQNGQPAKVIALSHLYAYCFDAYQ